MLSKFQHFEIIRIFTLDGSMSYCRCCRRLIGWVEVAKLQKDLAFSKSPEISTLNDFIIDDPPANRVVQKSYFWNHPNSIIDPKQYSIRFATFHRV